MVFKLFANRIKYFVENQVVKFVSSLFVNWIRDFKLCFRNFEVGDLLCRWVSSNLAESNVCSKMFKLFSEIWLKSCVRLKLFIRQLLVHSLSPLGPRIHLTADLPLHCFSILFRNRKLEIRTKHIEIDK